VGTLIQLFRPGFVRISSPMTSNYVTKLRVPFGLRGGRLVDPTQIEKTGLACDCLCPGCDTPLVLRQGKKRRHFAHYRAVGTAHCVESAIHAAAVQALLESKSLQVPEMFVNASVPTKAGPPYAKFRNLGPARMIRFNATVKEKVFAGADGATLRADVAGYRGERVMIVEMCFTHAVDEAKLALLRQLGLPALEIDVADLDMDAGMEAVRRRVLDDTVGKRWLYYPGEEGARARLLAEIEKEAAELDAAFDAEQEKQARRRQENVLRKLASEREAQAAIEQYRAMPDANKEARLRQQLRMSAAWPRHLQVTGPKMDAVAAPARLWQASLFHRYVHKKPINDFSFSLEQAATWVAQRFPARDGTGYTVTGAVRAYLAYLKGCGFVSRQYNPYGSDAYLVLHNELMPPKRQDSGISPRPPVPVAHTTAPAVMRQYEWDPDWPSYEIAMAAATQDSSLYRDACITMVTMLYRAKEKPDSPEAFLAELHGWAMSEYVVMTFLFEAGLARYRR
jgi:hypothetical protein